MGIKQRLLLCCDKPLFADGFSALLESEPEIEIIGHTTGDLVLRDAAENCPDITLVVAPALTLVTHQRELAELAGISKVILIAKAENAHRSVEAIGLGVSAVLSLDTSSDQLIQALRLVMAGETLLIPESARQALCPRPEAAPREAGHSLSANLTGREKEVLLLLGRGASNVEIARELSISITTVRTHVHNVLKKLDVGTRGQAVAVAYKSGLITRIGTESSADD
ncbi:response regulator transcription factor [Actinomadura madurae]|uniref:response regulator transcription factor n=1 Tax=Actinomadura madurae TaxID=1993 RepID=UPI0020270BE0|nr:response regulator transcription factor [Actinomadura madurae]MCP9949847.1 response regulator transcription factor [Actinomadura madurae]MCP9979088.1 response regulator transcription factor [Actinomadura madurae]MCQ0009385.1 response regulator transcription factor [Actinomadura madurae]MCQ0015272.1 response regulator transcription factor [Actinomadura madurae]URM95420.1 response regulator transcription factor [Actinomadura madurae]